MPKATPPAVPKATAKQSAKTAAKSKPKPAPKPRATGKASSKPKAKAKSSRRPAAVEDDEDENGALGGFVFGPDACLLFQSMGQVHVPLHCFFLWRATSMFRFVE